MEKENSKNIAQDNGQPVSCLSKQSAASLSKFLSRCTLSPNEIDEFVNLLSEIAKISGTKRT